MLSVCVLSVAPALAEKPNRSRDGMREMARSMGSPVLEGKELEKAITDASAYPLGSKENPVRENMPEGQRAYLSKLRCEDGNAPQFLRAGNVGIGPYGFFVDRYQVTCKNKDPVSIHIDMYHDGGETQPVAGFTMVTP